MQEHSLNRIKYSCLIEHGSAAVHPSASLSISSSNKLHDATTWLPAAVIIPAILPPDLQRESSLDALAIAAAVVILSWAEWNPLQREPKLMCIN
jgi:hypothetical protein